MVGLWCSSTTTRKKKPWYVIDGTMLAEVEVQRTIKRAELWVFTMALSGFSGPSTRPYRQRGHFGSSRREEGCVGPQQKYAN